MLMVNDAFDHLSLFEGLNPAQKDLLMQLFTPCEFLADTMIFAQGDPADYLYVVVEGEVIVSFKPDDGPPITVTRVQPGGVVGWSAALGSRAYTSAGICTTDVQMLRVRGTDLRNLCEKHPDTGLLILDRLANIIAERLRNTHDQVVALLETGLRNGVHSTGG